MANSVPDGTPFGHGFTYSGHPVSAAVALEVLRLYTEGGLIENAKTVGKYFGEQLRTLADHPLVGDIRNQGLLAAIEIVTDKEAKTKPTKEMDVAARLAKSGYENRIIFRAFADDCIGLAPPISTTKEDVDLLVSRLRLTLDSILDIKG